jgi:hypothetical protein
MLFVCVQTKSKHKKSAQNAVTVLVCPRTHTQRHHHHSNQPHSVSRTQCARVEGSSPFMTNSM